MAVVRLGPNGEVEVLVPATPEEIAEGDAAILRVIEALARATARKDFAAMQADAGKAVGQAATVS